MSTEAVKKGIGRKLFSVLSTISLLILFVGFSGFISIQILSNESKRITKDEVPRIRVIQESILSFIELDRELHDLTDITSITNIDKINIIEHSIKNNSSQFDLFITALNWGSESSIFQKIENGGKSKQWNELGYRGEIILKTPSLEQAQLAGEAKIFFKAYNTVVLELITKQKQLLFLEDSKQLEKATVYKESIYMHKEYLDIYFNQVLQNLNSMTVISNKATNSAVLSIERVERNILILALLIPLLIFLLSVMLSSIFSRRTITTPLKNLIEALKNNSTSDLSTVAQKNSDTEIGNLANIFNEMIKRIKKSTKGLEEKTEELVYSLKESEEQNIYLEDIKKATINIMEDLAYEKDKTLEEKAKDEAILSNIGHGIVVIDALGRMILVNKAAEILLGSKKDELLGKTWPHNLVIKDKEGNNMTKEQIPIYQSIKTRKKISTKNYTFTTNDMAEMPVSITTSPVIMNKELKAGVLVFYDITKEKEVDRMKTEFISLASHQLRTPLAAMKWFSEMLLSEDVGTLTDEQRDFVESISKSNERMISLVNALLNISRIESGRIIIEPKEVVIEDLLNDILDEFSEKFKEKNIKFLKSISSNMKKINVDPKLIKEVYVNLISNALKYTPDNGEISIFISEKSDEIVSQVSDTGYGIPKEDHDKIFGKFFRASNITKVETDGSGLGLYLVKAIIESSGGRIWFKSEEGKGTTFWFSLPKKGMKAKKGDVSFNA